MLIALHGLEATARCMSILGEAGYVVTALNGVEIRKHEGAPSEILAIHGGAA
jgi:hypothetical protein